MKIEIYDHQTDFNNKWVYMATARGGTIKASFNAILHNYSSQILLPLINNKHEMVDIRFSKAKGC